MWDGKNPSFKIQIPNKYIGASPVFKFGIWILEFGFFSVLVIT
jgi:hypothetical protein